MLSSTKQSANNHQESEKVRKSGVNFITGPLQVNQVLQTILDEVDKAKCDQMLSADNNSAVGIVRNKGCSKRKKLADFYPLSQEDADLL